MLSRLASFVRRSFVLVALVGAVGACDPQGADGPPAVSVDSTVYAADRARLQPDVEGDVVAVELRIDGQRAAGSEEAPFELPYTTEGLAPGEHALEVIARSSSGEEAKASAKLVIDRQAPELVAEMEPDRDSAQGVRFSVKDGSPIRWIHLTVRDEKEKTAYVYTCTQVPEVAFQGCAQLTITLNVQDAAANRSQSRVDHEGEAGTCKIGVSPACKAYRP